MARQHCYELRSDRGLVHSIADTVLGRCRATPSEYPAIERRFEDVVREIRALGGGPPRARGPASSLLGVSSAGPFSIRVITPQLDLSLKANDSRAAPAWRLEEELGERCRSLAQLD